MSSGCGNHHHELPAFAEEPGRLLAYRRTLWIALVLNASMFVVEIAAGHASRSLALFSDSLDFFSDSVTYALTLGVLSAALVHRARAAIFKAASMALFGGGILVAALWRVTHGVPPEAPVMGGVGVLALGVNVVVALLLLRHRGGDANRRSVWLCSRNDAIGNVVVVLAAAGVAVTGTGWPDLVVAASMATLSLWTASTIMRQARAELARA